MSNFPNAAAATATRQELQRLFTPAISLMNRLKYPYKFALITLLFLLPLTLTMSLFVINLNRQIEFSRREIIGTQYLRTLWPPLVHATQSHSRRTDSTEVQATQHPLPEVTEQILKELTTVGTLHRQRGLNHEVTSAVRKLQESQKSLVETAMSKNPDRKSVV